MRALVIWLAVGLGGCSILPLYPTPAPAPTRTVAAPVVVYADAALANVLRDIRTSIEQADPALKVEFTFAEPPDLQTRLASTLRPELVITSDMAALDRLKQQNRLAGEPRLVANDLVVIVIARMNPAGIERVEDLNRTDLRVALAPEATPLGKQTRLLVENMRRDAAFGPDFPTSFFGSVIISPTTGGEILQRLVTNRADVGVVFASEAGLYQERVQTLALPSGLDVATGYYAAALQGTRDPARGQRVLDALRSSQAQTLWRDYGFEPVN